MFYVWMGVALSTLVAIVIQFIYRYLILCK